MYKIGKASMAAWRRAAGSLTLDSDLRRGTTVNSVTFGTNKLISSSQSLIGQSVG